MLMTGTPLENSVQEFRNLIGYIRPDLAESAPEFLASMFRKHVAPAYLRRNQEDVLTELPELVEIDEWMGMSDADERAYRNAVQEGHFMDMRRAAMLSKRSLKVERLMEIVEEAKANGRRVIVFSYFREVLNEVARLLPGQVFGPLTGAVPAAERQSLIDRFSQAGHGAVLVAQITAGGVGLNIQSASVVVICEPQLKPTTESQAIGRAHRMGQTNTVQVHRLLTENSVDERIREIVADKQQLFDEFARDSVIAQQAPDAVDVSEAELARIVVAAERKRLFGQTGSVTD
jgi:SNF2 family DNA or RNA helicase